MRTYLALGFLFLTGVLCSAQTVLEMIPELVFQFPNGKGDLQLGINIKAAQRGADTDYFARAVLVDGDSVYILDNVNSRLVQYSMSMRFIRSYEVSTGGLARIWKAGTFIIVGNNLIGSDRSRGLTIIDSRSQGATSAMIESTKSPLKTETFGFVASIDGVLIFQSRNESYFGIRVASGSRIDVTSLLSEEEVRQLFSGKSGQSYVLQGRSVLSGSVLLSNSPKTAQSFMRSIPGFQEEQFSFLGNTEYLALPNDLGFFFGRREFLVFDSEGRNRGYWSLPANDELLKNSNFAPSPDGYVYYLHCDVDKAWTNLYRVGPIPEVNLGFGSVSAITNDDQINLRDSSSTRGAVLLRVGKSVPVRILDRSEKPETIGGLSAPWYKVRLWDRTEGWVFGAFLDVQQP